jgi:hypothetical protein
MLHGQEPVAQLRKRQLTLGVMYLPSFPAKVSQCGAREPGPWFQASGALPCHRSEPEHNKRRLVNTGRDTRRLSETPLMCAVLLSSFAELTAYKIGV